MGDSTGFLFFSCYNALFWLSMICLYEEAAGGA